MSGTCTPGVTSSASVLTINEAPEVITNPVSQTVCAGQSVTFSVNAGVTTSPTYQWRKNSVDIPGATRRHLYSSGNSGGRCRQLRCGSERILPPAQRRVRWRH
ncbi:MAG: immunoglobulin domain-containing protein [Cyclobacteriaceae bacterium]|nr:immunoglobulin domain-containing protein [Cyclobacteriaceae bacterium]